VPGAYQCPAALYGRRCSRPAAVRGRRLLKRALAAHSIDNDEKLTTQC
jgi:hypothetical protein